MALASSPHIREARATLCKAAAARSLAKSDFVPNVAVMGLYSAQDTTDLIQEDFSGIGVTGTHTLFEWGKKKQVLRERETTLGLAQQNLRRTMDTVRLEALGAYRTYVQTGQALELAEGAAQIYRKLPLPTHDPRALVEAIKERAAAEAAAATAQIDHRNAYAELMTITGRIDCLR